jgi:TP901 family phage tail tape measure protein
MRQLIIPSVFTAVDKFSGPVDKMSKSVSAFANTTQRNFRNAGQSAFEVGRAAGAVGLAIVAPLGLAVKTAVDFEDKMADVAKTTGLTGEPLEDLGNSILSMSKNTRSSINDLVQIAEIGGQLGVASSELVDFTNSADKFNIALGSDFSGGVEEAVSQVGKIKGLFAETRDVKIAEMINRTGSAINELGAVGAGTSANITDFTLRLGALPDALKPSIQNTLALGTYLEELGIDAQIGAGGVTNLLLVAGKNVAGFAQQMKMSATDAKSLLAQDPTEFAKKFASTFDGVAPEILAQKLNKLGVGSQETIKVIGALGSGMERLTELQEVSANSFKAGTSLTSEAAKKNDTMAAKASMLKNNMQQLAITVGNALLPVLNSIVSSVMPIVDRFSNWISNNKELTATILKVVAGAGLLALGISAVAFGIGIYRKAVVIAEAVQWAWNAAMTANPLGLIIAAAAAAALAIYSLSKAFSSMSSAEQLANSVRERALENTLDQRVEVDMLFRTLKNAKVGTDEYKDAVSKLVAINPELSKQYVDQNGIIKDRIGYENALAASIMKRAEMEARAELIKEKFKAAQQARDTGDTGSGFMNFVLDANEFMGGPLSALVPQTRNKFAERNASNLEGEAGILSQQQADAQMLTKSETKTEKQKLEIDFKNMPAGVTTNLTGGSAINLPKNSSTR